jgi:hypothetical protein
MVWGFSDRGPLADDSDAELKRGQLNVCISEVGNQ